METKGDELDSSDDKLLTHALKDQIIKGHEDPGLAYHTTGTNQGADGRSLCRRQNVGAVGIAGGWGRRRRGPSAQISRRHSRICADGHRRPRGHPRHKRTGAVGTPSPSAQDNDRWAQKLRPLSETSSADGQAVGSDAWAMPTAKPSAQLIFFLNLFIVLKNLNLFIYVLYM
jgi:hypothetical protein